MASLSLSGKTSLRLILAANCRRKRPRARPSTTTLAVHAIVRIDPPLPVLVKRGGDWLKGMAHWLIDYGYEHHLCFVTFLDESRECWTVENRDVRAQDNITAGRMPRGAPDHAGPRKQEPHDGQGWLEKA